MSCRATSGPGSEKPDVVPPRTGHVHGCSNESACCAQRRATAESAAHFEPKEDLAHEPFTQEWTFRRIIITTVVVAGLFVALFGGLIWRF